MKAVHIPRDGVDLTQILKNVERIFVEQALLDAGNNHAKAARMLKLNRTTLVEKMRKLGMKLNKPHGFITLKQELTE